MKLVSLSVRKSFSLPSLMWRILLVAALLAATAAPAGAAVPSPARLPETVGPEAAQSAHLVVENVGQFAPEARFLLRQGDRQIWLTGDAVWLTVPDPVAAEKPGRLAAALSRREAPRNRALTGTALRFTFPGAQPGAALEPFGRLATHVSFLLGNDPARWQSDVPAWSGVRYRDLYPGIDLVVGGDAAGAVPWRLEARAGADLSAVKLLAEGAEATAGEAGDLRFQLAGRTVSVAAPAWVLDGAATITGGLAEGGGANAFALSPQPLATAASPAAPDAPTDLVYSRVLGGAPADGGEGIAVDSAGSAYITGATSSGSFPGVAGHYDASYNGATDAFVARLSPDAAQILYATYLGGAGLDLGAGIAVANGIAYITGGTSSVDFPGTAGSAGGMDAFVAALNANGNSLRYAWLVGGSVADDMGLGIAVQGTDAYIIGSAGSYDLPGQLCGAVVLGTTDMLVARLGATGAPVYVRCFGGGNDDRGYGIAVANQVAYVTGETWSEDIIFPQPPLAGENDMLVAAFGGDGTMQGVTFIGGSLGDQGSGIGADVSTAGSGSLYIAGSTSSNNFALAAPRSPDRFDSDAVIVRVGVTTPKPGSIQFTHNFATYLGGSSDDLGRGLALDTVQALYVSGATTSTDFPVTGGAYDIGNPNGTTDAFVARMDLDVAGANKVTYATYLGADGEDAGARVATDTGGHAFLTGSTNGQGFPVTAGPAPVADDQAFVAKLKLSSPPGAPVVTIAASSPDVVLTWGSVGGAGRYQAFRSTIPYFLPGDWSSVLLPDPTTSPYRDGGALTPEGGSFYVVKAVSVAPEAAGASSNRVGKFTYKLVAGDN